MLQKYFEILAYINIIQTITDTFLWCRLYLLLENIFFFWLRQIKFNIFTIQIFYLCTDTDQ